MLELNHPDSVVLHTRNKHHNQSHLPAIDEIPVNPVVSILSIFHEFQPTLIPILDNKSSVYHKLAVVVYSPLSLWDINEFRILRLKQFLS